MTAADVVLGAALEYRMRGYSPIPLRPTTDNPKGLPPKGVTGYRGRYYSTEELPGLTWKGRKLALRLPGDVVGVDVDAYHDGLAGLAELEAKYGALAPTVMAHNERGDGSGIRLYRVPIGTTLHTDPAQGIDMIQWFHRYVLAAPSLHPEGRLYAWHDQADDDAVEWPCEPGDLPELPWGWITGLAAVKGTTAATAATPEQVQAFIAAHTQNLKPKFLNTVGAKLATATSAHDTMVTTACWAMREAAAGYYSADRALKLLETWWRTKLAAEPRRRDGGEFGAIIAWAVAVAEADTERVAEMKEAAETPPPSHRDVLVGIVQDEYLIGRTEDERVYIVPLNGPNFALFSGAAKSNLSRRFLELTGGTVGRTPLDEMWMTVEGLALDVVKAPLPMRVGAHEGMIVVDIGDTTGRAITVDVTGWSVADRAPITFRRSRAMLPLPLPEHGGDIAELFELLNVERAHRDLFAAWMTSTLFETLPHPAPTLLGEQGAAKSSTARSMTRLVDPCMAATQKPPKTDDDWAMTCSARYVVAVDNVSHVSEWWSDALCRTITGDGWLRRQLYTDDEVVATAYRRCVILNGITLGASLRPDLAERLILFNLERPTQWLTERDVDARLDAMRPRILGVLLDRAAATIAQLPLTESPTDLRMADYAHLLAAYDAATGSRSLDAYRAQVDAAFGEALESDPVAVAVITFMSPRDEWIGTPSELLTVLDIYRPDDRSNGDSHRRWRSSDPAWPATARAMTTALARAKPLLRRAGIEVTRPPRTTSARLVILRRTAVPNDDGMTVNDGHDGGPPFVVSDSVGSEKKRESNGSAQTHNGATSTTREGRPSSPSLTVIALPTPAEALFDPVEMF